ncbi:exported protein of unknown function [Modestobacter italicus]|uniref:Polysaccharide chain length determinant N-terminal domain-containing protein n=1 Tax=Modestobacter italicus (strain DSM 44449 / CECT 9708 / BC 501) TaxID=2732864 RepID=I4ERA1_MODI5|nr:hypothetical protein [Modestobacter marinus]CCH85914.1 exported protein of unknown function [Modestobacter marinus]
MTFTDVLRACARRWYVLVLVLALTAFGAVQAHRAARPSYTVTATLVVLPSPSLVQARLPTSGSGGLTTNPFNAQTGGSTLAAVLADALNTAVVRDQVLAGGRGTASAGWDNQAAQLVELSTVSSSAEDATELMTRLVAGAETEVARVQLDAGAPADQLFTTAVGSPADYPLRSYPDRLRSVVGLALVGLLAAMLAAVLLDRLVLAGARARSRRRRRRAARRDAAQVAPGEALVGERVS